MKKIKYVFILGLILTFSFNVSQAQLIEKNDDINHILAERQKVLEKFEKVRANYEERMQNALDKFILNPKYTEISKADAVLKAADKARIKYGGESEYEKILLNYYLENLKRLYIANFNEEEEFFKFIDSNLSKIIKINKITTHQKYSTRHDHYEKFVDLSRVETVITGSPQSGEIFSVEEPITILKRNGEKLKVSPLAIVQEIDKYDPNISSIEKKTTFNDDEKFVMFFTDLGNELSSKPNNMIMWDFIGVSK